MQARRMQEAGDSLTIRGKEVPVRPATVEHTRLRFFVDNPRIYSMIRAKGKDPSQEEIQDQLLQLEHVRALVLDIKQNGGIIDPLVVIDGSLEVVEGNSRLAAYRHLAKQEPLRWAKVKCTLLPSDIDHSLLFALLGQYHIKGKKDWAPYEQAGFLYRRYAEHKIDVRSLAAEIGLSARKVKHLIDTYQFMLDHNETTTDRWSYYHEYLRSPKVRKARRTFHDFDRMIVQKINSGEIKRAVDVRDQLPVICESGRKVLRKFVEGKTDFEEAYEDALAGGAASSQLKRIAAFRKWLTSSSVDPVLRTDGQTRGKIIFELTKIAARAQALRTKLETRR